MLKDGFFDKSEDYSLVNFWLDGMYTCVKVTEDMFPEELSEATIDLIQAYTVYNSSKKGLMFDVLESIVSDNIRWWNGRGPVFF